MACIQLSQRDGAARRQVRIGRADRIADEHQSGQMLGNHRIQLHDVSAGGHSEHAVVVIAIVIADHRDIRQLDRTVLRVHGEQHIPNHRIRLDDDVAFAHLDVGVRVKLLAANQILEENVSAGDDIQRLIRRADGAGRAGDERDVLDRFDVRRRLIARPAIQKASGLIGHGDDHLPARKRAERVAHPGNLDQLLRVEARPLRHNAAVGAHADAAGQRVVEHAVLGFNGQPGLAAVRDQRFCAADLLGRLIPVRAVEVPVPSLNILGHHVGQAFERHVLILLQEELRLNRRVGAAVAVDFRVRVGDLHVAGLIRPAVEDRSKLAGTIGVRVHEHQHLAAFGDVQVIVDAIALSGDVIVRRQRGLLDRDVPDRAVELGIADRLRIGIAALVGVRIVESDKIAGIRVVRIGRLDHQRRHPRAGIGDFHFVAVEIDRLIPRYGEVIVALFIIRAEHDAFQILAGVRRRCCIAVGKVHILQNL